MGSRGQSMAKERRRAENRAVKQLAKILGGGVIIMSTPWNAKAISWMNE